MKLNGLIWGAMALAMTTACSNDDSITATSESTDGDALYLNVRIKSASDFTRAGEVFENGTELEQTIGKVGFYFYDEFGNYMTNADNWNNKTVTNNANGSNIEFNNKTTIRLTAKENNFPAYVVTVLNVPEEVNIPTTLNGWKGLLTNNFKGIRTQTDHNFIMTTSSFLDTTLPTTAQNNEWWYVTALNSNNYFTDEEAAENAEDARIVNIYVERLAAKVRVTLSDALKAKAKTLEDGSSIYEITVYNVNDVANGDKAGKRIYVKLLGWGVSATTKNSNLVKIIDTETNWKDKNLGFVWNSAEYHRSYWGKSYNYNVGKGGGAKYPDYYQKPGEDNGSDNEYAQGTGYLTYLASGQLVRKFDGTIVEATGIPNNVSYCPENTNTEAILNAHYPSAITYVVVKAQAVDENGKSLGNLIRHNTNVVYTEEEFILNAIENMTNTGSLAKVVDADAEGGVRNLTKDEVAVVDDANLNGRVKLALTTAGEALTFEGDKTAAEVNTQLYAWTKTNTANKYTNGLMYYYVLVRHLGGVSADKDLAKGDVTEGFYGIVRNHIYDLSINELTSLGYGITNAGNPSDPSDPESDEEPNDPDDPDNDDDPDDPTEDDYPGEPIIPVDETLEKYYIGASINILSWRTVSQTVNF